MQSRHQTNLPTPPPPPPPPPSRGGGGARVRGESVVGQSNAISTSNEPSHPSPSIPLPVEGRGMFTSAPHNNSTRRKKRRIIISPSCWATARQCADRAGRQSPPPWQKP